MKVSGFLPRGFLERLICKVVNWSQVTLSEYADINISQIYKDVAIMRYGGQRFQLSCLMEHNTIKVDVEGEYSVAIYKRLYAQIKVLISECMKSLHFIPTLLYSPGSGTGTGTTEPTSSIIGSIDYCHVTVVEALKLIETPGYVVESIDRQHLISYKAMKAQHPGWFGSLGFLPKYDVFLSHRWPDRSDKSNVLGSQDEKLVESIYDRLTLYTIEQSNRSIDTFLDSRRLKKGRNCVHTISRKHCSSRH